MYTISESEIAPFRLESFNEKITTCVRNAMSHNVIQLFLKPGLFFKYTYQLYLYGDFVSDSVIGSEIRDMKVAVVSSKFVRNDMFKEFNRLYECELPFVYQDEIGYQYLEKLQTNGIVVHFDALELVFVSRLEDIQATIDVDALAIEIAQDPNYIYTVDDIGTTKKIGHSLSNVLSKKFEVLANIQDLVRCTKNKKTVANVLFRICEMYKCGYRNADSEFFLQFVQLYKAYRDNKTRTVVISVGDDRKEKLIEEVVPQIFEYMKSY